MSDQSTPTGEWTVEQRITNYLASGGLFNPELADHDAVSRLLFDCREQLATERKKREQWTINANTNLQIAERNAQINDSLRSQLAAEEDKRADWNVVIEDLVKQLTAEQERSKELDEDMVHYAELCYKKDDVIQQLRSQVKTLVDALKKIKQVTDLGMIDQLCDAALAKAEPRSTRVKEDLK